ncbi:TetR/AcrR family transcriptional regulator [Mycolicibacterium porcinum]
MSPARAPRSDGVHNRVALLAAAEAAYGESGLHASMADIARRAGLAKGTVFHHFATKDALLAAVLLRRLDTLLDAGRGLLDDADPESALVEFLALGAQHRLQNDLAVVQNSHADNGQLTEIRDRMLTLLDALLRRAQAAGVIRADVTGVDVALLMCAPAHVASFAPDPGPDLWRRYLAIIIDGLRPQGSRPLPGTAPATP